MYRRGFLRSLSARVHLPSGGEGEQVCCTREMVVEQYLPWIQSSTKTDYLTFRVRANRYSAAINPRW